MQYTVKHTNTSTAAASGIVITCIFENLEPVTADLTANKISTVNSTTVTVKPGGVSPSSLNLGERIFLKHCPVHVILDFIISYPK